MSQYIGHTLDTLINKYSSESKINWVIPDVSEELGEYFENSFTYNYLKSRGIVFHTEEELLKVLSQGVPQEIKVETLISQGVNLTTNIDDFKAELIDSEYAASYNEMTDTLITENEITLPMPILLKIGNIYYGFAGNRRMNLAWSDKLSVTFYVVTLK